MELRITGQHLLKIWLYLKDIHVYLIFSEEMARIIIVCIHRFQWSRRKLGSYIING